jgi:hypothetical protein
MVCIARKLTYSEAVTMSAKPTFKSWVPFTTTAVPTPESRALHQTAVHDLFERLHQQFLQTLQNLLSNIYPTIAKEKEYREFSEQYHIDKLVYAIDRPH